MSSSSHDRKRADPEDILASLNRPLPFSDEAERGVVSSVMQSVEWLEECCAEMPPEAFHSFVCRSIFGVIVELHKKGVPIDDILVTNTMRAQETLDKVGGPAAITGLFTFVPIPAHYRHYKKIVLESWQARRYITALAKGIQHLQEFGRDPAADSMDEVKEHIREVVSDVDQDNGSPDLPCTPIKRLVQRVIDETSERAEHPGRMLGVSTGFDGLDADTSGIQTGQFWTVLGASSSGKSLLARQLLESWCEAGHRAVIYTWEMQDTQETLRLLCSQARVSNGAFARGKFSRGEQDAISRAVRIVSEMPIDIVDCAGVTIEAVWNNIARRVRKLPPGINLLAEIDYIQLASTKKDFTGRRQQQIAYITQGCKQAAKKSKLNKDAPPRAAIIGLSQVNRDGDAREGEDIINDSDVSIKLLSRSTSGDGGKKPFWKKKTQAEPTEDRDYDLYVVKNRNGKRFGKFPVRKVGEMFRFEQERQESAELPFED